MHRLCCLILCLLATSSLAAVRWRAVLDQPEAWYGSDEARAIADHVLLYQTDAGGWPKNIDMTRPPSAEFLASTERDVRAPTIDNGATHTQLRLLARVHRATAGPRYRAAFERGFDYLLDAQYENGGWPQYFPLRRGYYTHITFNDDAMISVLAVLREASRGLAPYEFVDAERRARAADAVARGIDCILRCQIVVNGEKTGWCAQHDEKTFAPVAARAYEHASLSGFETVGIARFLMTLDTPSPDVVAAINAAARWLDAAKVTGIRIARRPAPELRFGFDPVVVADPAAPPLWARFYEIGTNRPIFSGRDGVIHYALAEIEPERRGGYRWYITEPRALLEKDYPRWLQRHRGATSALLSNPPLAQAGPGLNRSSGNRKVRIVLVGDSTVTERSGWGLGFRKFLTGEVECINVALGGRSSKSFRDEGHWEPALALPGDYYLIQFGHNDQPGKGPERETDPGTTYAENMARYIDDVRAIGATPILITSLTRRNFDPAGTGKIASTLTPYVDAVKRIANARGVALIDLHARSVAWCEQLGPAACAGLNPAKDSGEPDTTHLDAEGSVLFARLLVEDLRRIVPQLAPFLREEPVLGTEESAPAGTANAP